MNLSERDFDLYSAEVPALRAELLSEAITAACYPVVAGQKGKGQEWARRVDREIANAMATETLEERGVKGRAKLREMLGQAKPEPAALAVSVAPQAASEGPVITRG